MIFVANRLAPLIQQQAHLTAANRELATENERLQASKDRAYREYVNYQSQIKSLKAVAEQVGNGSPCTSNLRAEAKKSAQETQSSTNALSQALSSGASEKARVYIHVSNPSQENGAIDLATELRKREFVVPGIENIAGHADHTEVRYFHDEDLRTARLLVNILKAFGVKDASVSREEDPARQKHFEIWLYKDAAITRPS
jgi:hypothetical protein